MATELEHLSRLEPSTAAWVVAETCRRAMPAADPSPGSHGAPVVREDEGEFRVRFSAWGSDGFRVFFNGRLTPPATRDGSAAPGPVRLGAAAFHPAGRSLGTAALSDAGVEARIRGVAQPIPGGPRCLVEVELFGHIPARRLIPHIRSALELADAIQESAQLLRDGQLEAAGERVRRCREQQPELCCQGHIAFRAHLLYHQALATTEPGPQRLLLEQSLALAPQLTPARQALCALQLRLGRHPSARRNARLLDNAGRPSRQLQDRLRTTPTGPLGDGPSLLAKGDLHGADQAALNSLLSPQAHHRAHRLRADLHRRARRPQRALEEDWAALLRGGYDAGLVLRIAADYLELDNPAAAVHLLLRHRDAMPAHLTEDYATTLRTALLATEPKLGLRILNSRGAIEALDWLERAQLEGALGPAASELSLRLPLLRAGFAAPAPERRRGFEAIDGYRHAPGVQPPR